jgi:hypothetical protein
MNAAGTVAVIVIFSLFREKLHSHNERGTARLPAEASVQAGISARNSTEIEFMR